MEGAGDSFTSASTTTTTRLHITPLDPDLLKVIIPAKAIPVAANISYHTLETFPEKRYGFVDLPTEEADRIKKKLNGAVLKGVKIRIEKARQSKEDLIMARRKEEEERSGDKDKKTKKEKVPKEKKDRSKKRKRDDEEIAGVELEEGRKVKRGWTVSPKEAREAKSKDKSKKKDKDKDKAKDKKKRKEQKSVYTEGPECLIRTVLPATALAEQDGSVKKRKKKDKTVVIHEFKKTKTFPTFLKSSTSANSIPTEYVEGTGWVDQDGNVVEAVRSTRSTGRRRKEKSPSPHTSSAVEGDAQDDPKPTSAEPDAEDTTSSSGSDTSSDEESEEEEASNEILPPMKLRPDSISIPETPSPSKDEAMSAVSKTHSPRPKSASSVMSLTIKIPPATPVTPGKASVHPLEALYKRPKPDGKESSAVSEEKPGFTFFGGEDFEDQDMEDEANSGALQPPMTPFTRQDWEHRNIRSAAPTPDTAHHNRSFRFWPPPGEEDDIAEDEEEEDGDDDNEAGDNNGSASEAAAASGEKAPTTDFQKWFWENRGDLNRSWKKRRKLAGKEKRYRENRSRASRAV
ncbi:hypothetical protein MCOR25_003663 [Pyricularia grisea]|uniref:RRM domain-containing protein n=1 Tax=Pyricularia grisea TaxID=148305 RepID=A0A6P8B0U5_PYRGI|nr:uncharacterized protein PgNI_07465 [Pyricularia grisea]KAI6372697.1 hypothetical protein MCOR25_003663 [Pyricularia grisea]TLD08338.1 hypothetical protein PgNI_07465 [Pyricularia grisea]